MLVSGSGPRLLSCAVCNCEHLQIAVVWALAACGGCARAFLHPGAPAPRAAALTAAPPGAPARRCPEERVRTPPMRTGTMLVAGAHAQEQTHHLRLCDGHGLVEVVYKDVYGLIGKNKEIDVPAPN